LYPESVSINNCASNYKTTELSRLLYEIFLENQEWEVSMNVIKAKPPDTAQTFYRRVGNTNFKVRVLFSENATETMEDKILRIVRNSGEHFGEKYDIMTIPQMSRQSERSA